MGNDGTRAPHPALRGHLPVYALRAAFGRLRSDTRLRAQPKGKAGGYSTTSHPGKYHSKISRQSLPSSAMAFAPYWLNPTPWP